MTTTQLAIPAEYVDILKTFGSVDDLITEAVRRYTIERITERIATAQREIATFEAKYGQPYKDFRENITTNLDFLSKLKQQYPMWERNFNVWEFYVEELNEWQSRLQKLSCIKNL